MHEPTGLRRRKHCDDCCAARRWGAVGQGLSRRDTDPYGIGLPKGSDGVAFVNAFLKKIEADGTWAKLWTVAIGQRTGNTNVPTPPPLP